jgi:hypothetical protein
MRVVMEARWLCGSRGSGDLEAQCAADSARSARLKLVDSMLIAARLQLITVRDTGSVLMRWRCLDTLA